MSCDQLQFLQRLAVEECGALEGDEWREHIEMCEECQGEWDAYSRSLAIFTQLEKERISRFTPVPNWNEISGKLAKDWRRWNLIRQLRVPVAAAVLAGLTVAGLSAWMVGGGVEHGVPVAKESPASAVPTRGEIRLPRIPSSSSPQLNYVSSESPRVAWPINQAPKWNGAHVFELRSGEIKIGVVQYGGGKNAAANGILRNELKLRRRPAGQALWNPPNATRSPGQPARVEYPVYGTRAR